MIGVRIFVFTPTYGYIHVRVTEYKGIEKERKYTGMENLSLANKKWDSRQSFLRWGLK